MKNFIQKFLSICLLIFLFTFIIEAIVPSSASAANGFNGRGTSGNDSCPAFLGLTSWDCNVSITDEESLKTGIWQIVANVATDLTVVAAYLVLGYVIYGGYKYTFSRGDPGKIALGKKTLVQAFIGLAIVMSANLIMGTIRIVLVSNGNLGDCTINDACVNPTEMVESLITWGISFIGIVAVVFLIYGGVSYITANGDAGRLRKARDTILYAIIGLIVVAFAEIITGFVSKLLTEANANSFVQETIISKEISHEKTLQ